MLVTLELEYFDGREEFPVATLGIRNDNEYALITTFSDLYEVTIKSDETYDQSRPNAKWVLLKHNKISEQIECLLIDEIYNNTDLIIKDDRR